MAICLDRESLVREMRESDDWTADEIYYVDHLTEDRVGLTLSIVSTALFWEEYDRVQRMAIKRLLAERPPTL